jgi:hypothetical protein
MKVVYNNWRTVSRPSAIRPGRDLPHETFEVAFNAVVPTCDAPVPREFAGGQIHQNPDLLQNVLHTGEYLCGCGTARSASRGEVRSGVPTATPRRRPVRRTARAGREGRACLRHRRCAAREDSATLPRAISAAPQRSTDVARREHDNRRTTRAFLAHKCPVVSKT